MMKCEGKVEPKGNAVKRQRYDIGRRKGSPSFRECRVPTCSSDWLGAAIDQMYRRSWDGIEIARLRSVIVVLAVISDTKARFQYTGWPYHPLLCAFDEQIQTTDIIQKAVSRNNKATITRWPLSLKANQNGLKVASLQIPSMRSGEMVVRYNFVRISNLERRSPARLYGFEFSARVPKIRNSLLGREIQKPHHRPRSLPRKLDPTYSTCHSGQGGIKVAIHLRLL